MEDDEFPFNSVANRATNGLLPGRVLRKRKRIAKPNVLVSCGPLIHPANGVWDTVGRLTRFRLCDR